MTNLDQVAAEFAEALANLELLKMSVEIQEKSLQAEKANLAADRLQLEAEKTQVRVTQAQLNAAQSQLEDAKSQLETAQTQLSEARVQLEIARRHLEAAKAELGNDKTLLDAAKASLEAAKFKYEAATKQLSAAKIRFQSAKIQLDAATASIAAEKSGLEDEKAKLHIKVSQLESHKSKLETKVSQLEADKTNLETSLSQRESDKSKFEARVSQLENEKWKLEVKQNLRISVIQALNEKVKELERQSNVKMIKMIPARKLKIEWSETPQFWTWKVVPDSMYEVAELLNVCWLEITCHVCTRDLTPNTTYGIYLVFKLTSNHKGFYDPPSKAYMEILSGETSTRNVFLVAQGQVYHPTERHDGWMEVELGYYYVRGFNDGYLKVCLKEIEGGQWKSGLVVQGIEVRAK